MPRRSADRKPVAEGCVSRGRMTELRARFAQYDKSGDRTLDYEEMAVLLRKGYPGFTDDELKWLYEGVDKNGDGRISFDEFVDYVFKDTGEQREPQAKDPSRLYYDKDAYTGRHRGA